MKRRMIWMSTKIYNGYVLPFMNLNELTTFSQNFRTKAKQVAAEQTELFLARRIAEKLDALCILDEEAFIKKHVQKYEEAPEEAQKRYEIFGAFMHEYQNAYFRYQEVQRTNYRDNEVDVDANVVYIPLEDKTLALFYAEQSEMKDLWEKEEGVSYYGYWNNTDPDEDCTEEEWEQRKIDWDKALPGYTLPLEAGLIAEFVKGYPSRSELSSERILSKIPSAKVRANTIAKEKVRNEKFKQLEEQGIERGYEIVSQAAEWIQTEEGKQRIQEVAKNIEEKLFPVLTKEHLSTSYQKLKATIKK